MNSTGGEQRLAAGRDSRAPGDFRPQYFSLILLGIALLAAIPRLYLGASQFVEYDGYWHVWIAQQDRWQNFLWDYQANAHPPLYFLLLRLTFWFGRTQLVYRSVSLVSGVAAVYILGRTAAKAMRSPVWAALSALAYGLALPSILISNEVRTYMLSAFFAQISFYYFLDLVGEEQPPSIGPRVIFAMTAALACLTEYYALIYVAAALLFAIALPIVRRDRQWGRALLRETATFFLILALPISEYISHFGAQGVAFDHLPDFYYKAGAAESVVGFLLRNLRNELNWFSPWPVPVGSAFFLVMGGLLVAAGIIFFLVRRGLAPRGLAPSESGPKDTVAMVSLLLPLVMLGAIMAGSLMDAYPFGGFLRQQFVLFPFLVVCPFLLVDRLLAGLPRGASWASLALAGVMAVGVTAVSVQKYEAWPKISRLLLTDQMERYNRLFPSPEAIYIDQFNLTTFFMHHHDWKWEFAGAVPHGSTLNVYKLSRGNHSMLLIRDKNRWELDLHERELYRSIASGMRAWHLPSITIFCVAQSPGPARTDGQLAAYRAQVAELSAAQGLCVQTLDLTNYDVYAELRTSGGCTAR